MALDLDAPPPDRPVSRRLPLERAMRARVGAWNDVDDFLTCPSDALLGAFDRLAEAAGYGGLGSSLDAAQWHEVEPTSARALLLHLLSRSSAYKHRIRSPEAARDAADWFFDGLPWPRRYLVSSEQYEHVDDRGEGAPTSGWGTGKRVVDDHVFETWVVVVTPTTVAAFVQLDDD